MGIRPGRIGALVATTLLVVGSGCGGGRPAVDTSTAEATASGVVTVDGKPAGGNTISFDPSNVERKNESARSTTINEDGSYQITTLVGQNRVSFSGPLVDQYPNIANEAFMHDLQRGENTLNFELPTSAGTDY